MDREKARQAAMKALGQLLPSDDSGKMEERAIKGYIELLETEIRRYDEQERQQKIQMARIEEKQAETLATLATIKARLLESNEPEESEA